MSSTGSSGCSGAKAVVDALPYDFVQAMRNWQRSHDGQGQYAQSRAFDAVGALSAFDETRVPVLRGDAENVDNALAMLPVRLRQCVMLFWQHGEPELAWLGRRLSPFPLKPLDYRTVRARLSTGHELVIASLRQQRIAWRKYNDAAARASLVVIQTDELDRRA